MGIISSKQQQATLLAPSMEGNSDEVKRIVGTYIADNNVENTSSSLSVYTNAVDPSGNAAIHGAVFAGHLEILSFLVEKCGANLTMANGLGCSPLWIAAGYNRLECLQYLIDKLHENDELESSLLEDGKNKTGDTPFLAAASKGNMKACECLLRAAEKCSQDNKYCLETKANILRTANNAGDTPLKVAVASSQGEEILAFLLQIDGEISSIRFEKTELPRSEDGDLMASVSVNRKNKLGLSPLIIACERNLPNIAELLLQHGADICIQDAKGRNPLAIAAFCGCNDTLEFLLNQTSKKASLLNQQDSNGCTPVWLAARTGNLSIVKLLIDAGADATIKDNEGLLPHDVAAKFKKEKVQEYFSQPEI